LIAVSEISVAQSAEVLSEPGTTSIRRVRQRNSYSSSSFLARRRGLATAPPPSAAAAAAATLETLESLQRRRRQRRRPGPAASIFQRRRRSVENIWGIEKHNVGLFSFYYYYYYAALNAPCVRHKDDELQALMQF